MAKDNTSFTQDMISTEDFTIANTAQLSTNSIDLRAYALVGLEMPAAFTGTTMTFQFSSDNSTFLDLYDSSGNIVTITVGTSRHIGLLVEDFSGCRYLKIKSGSAEGGARTVTAVMRAV